jgi:Histidine kinase-like ATPase domain
LAVLPRRRPESDFSLTIDVKPLPEAVPHARHAVSKVLMSWGLADICDDAALCLTEAVTNALTHARPSGMVTVRIYRDCRSLRIEIADADRRLVWPVDHDQDLVSDEVGETGEVGQQRPPAARSSTARSSTTLPSEHGWGLHIVDALSSRWGAVADDTGKRVWFELDIPQQR